MAIYMQSWQQKEIQARVAELFRSRGVDPACLATDWTIDGEGYVKATAVVKVTPEEAAALINGPRDTPERTTAV